MDLTHYIFAFFVFLLVIACIWFFSRSVRTGKKQPNNEQYDREQRLFKLYQNIEDLMGGFEEYVEEARKEIDEKIAVATKMISSAQAVSSPPAVPSVEEAPVEEVLAEPAPKQTVKKALSVEKKEMPRKSRRTSVISDNRQQKLRPEELIPYLIDEGMDVGTIAKELGISSREVSTIMGIKKIADTDNKV